MGQDIANQCAIPLSHPDAVDLTRHAVIEASAGTGKTFTVENLVVRLLVGHDVEPVTIERILVVTFTEKATGDMKRRIRESIESRIAVETDEAACSRLRTALETFDSARISTIHGFCHRVLREYAFENGRQFDYEVVDDAPIYETALHRVFRSEWPDRYGAELETLLRFAQYPDVSGGDSRWEQTVLKLARDWTPARADRLHPEPAPDFCARTVAEQLRADVRAMQQALGDPPRTEPDQSAFRAGFLRLNVSPRTLNTLDTRVLTPALQFLARHPAESITAESVGEAWRGLLGLVDDCNGYTRFKQGDRGFACLIPDKWTKAGDNLTEVCPDLAALAAALDALRHRLVCPRRQLTVNTAVRLKHDVLAYKEEHGLLTYDDMLNMVAHAIRPQDPESHSTPLVDALRDQFDVAFVDEFQDTDAVQWEIFKQVFVEDSQSSGKRLFVVGDPKQAIYSFRGADLSTYFRAKRELAGLGDGTRTYSLLTNWRSLPELIDGCNALFGSGDWFGSDSGIVFEDAQAPAADRRRTHLVQDRTGTGALVLRSLPPDLTSKQGRTAWFELIADETLRLLEPGALLIGERSSNGRMTTRGLRADDICVLVRSNAEAQAIEQVLRDRRVPYTYYKKPGLYQSDEAMHLACLLHALAAPADSAALRMGLLSRFFALDLGETQAFEALPQSHRAKQLLDRWLRLSAERRWARLFRSMLTDSGLLLREAEQFDGERRLTNFEQIMQDLHRHACEENLDILGVWNCLDNQRRQNVTVSEEADLHRRETETPKVQLTTIHKSKGLDFPVVFLAGGFTSGTASPPFYKAHVDDVVLYDLTDREKEHYRREQDAETRRLYYVALTRAKCKLYVPDFQPQRASSPGPVITLIAPALRAAEHRRAADIASATAHVPGHSDGVAQSAAAVAAPQLGLQPPAKLPPPVPNLRDWQRAVCVESYSSLKWSVATRDLPGPTPALSELTGRTAFGGTDATDPAEDEDHPLSIGTPGRAAGQHAAAETPPPAEPGLPPGARSGNALHAVLEEISLDAVRRTRDWSELLAPGSRSASLIDQCMNYYGIPPLSGDGNDGQPVVDYRSEMARTVWTALRTPILEQFCLADLAPQDIRRELRFHYPFPASGTTTEPGPDARRDGFVEGIIDVVFRWRDRYYILDWKSDTLPAYSPEDVLRQHMEQRHYDLQHQLYTVAVSRWLAGTAGAGELGGVFYVFLRGLQPQSPTRPGVFFQSLSETDHRPGDLERDIGRFLQTRWQPMPQGEPL